MKIKYYTHQGAAEQIELFRPVVYARLDRSDVPTTRDCGDVDVAVVEQHLNVIATAEYERLLVVLVRQHDEFGALP